MKIGQWIKVTSVDDYLNIRVDEKFYDSERDDNKTIDWVRVQDNGVVIFHTK